MQILKNMQTSKEKGREGTINRITEKVTIQIKLFGKMVCVPELEGNITINWSRKWLPKLMVELQAKPICENVTNINLTLLI